MIIRIVKMTFKPDKVLAFLEIFNASKNKIRNSPGCQHLELLQDIKSPSVYFTYSYWGEESDLERYRNSDLFKKVWGDTKQLFDDKPVAYSVKRIDEVK